MHINDARFIRQDRRTTDRRHQRAGTTKMTVASKSTTAHNDKLIDNMVGHGIQPERRGLLHTRPDRHNNGLNRGTLKEVENAVRSTETTSHVYHTVTRIAVIVAVRTKMYIARVLPPN